MNTDLRPGTRTAAAPRRTAGASLPGLLLAGAGGAGSLIVAHLVPGVSPLLVAIVLGALLAGVGGISPSAAPGLGIASRRVLRIGVGLLGLEIAISELLALGWPVLLVIVGVVAGGIFGTLTLGRALGVPPGRRLLVACGFSICGAAAVAAVNGVRRCEDEDVAAVLALVVVLGSAAMLTVPVLASWFGLADPAAGAWSGAAVHEVGQVVVAGGLVGGAALHVAIVVKLGRVLLLAPVLTVLSWRARYATDDGGVRPPIVPLFVVAFVACMVLRSLVPLPGLVLDLAGLVQAGALTTAMFALGCGVDATALRRVGGRDVLLAIGSTLLVGALALPAAFLVV